MQINLWQRKTLANLANHWWFAKFYHPNFNIVCDLHEESKQAGIRQSFTHQKVLMRHSPKFSYAKNLNYTVHRLESDCITSSNVERDPRILVDNKLKLHKLCVAVVAKAKSFLI